MRLKEGILHNAFLTILDHVGTNPLYIAQNPSCLTCEERERERGI